MVHSELVGSCLKPAEGTLVLIILPLNPAAGSMDAPTRGEGETRDEE